MRTWMAMAESSVPALGLRQATWGLVAAVSEGLYFQQVWGDTALPLPGTSGLASVGVDITAGPKGSIFNT